MKRSQITKMYSQLSPQENGNLAFEALMQRDIHEVEVIDRAVKQQLYQMPDIRYRNRSQHLIHFSLYYGMIYWKNRTRSAMVEPLGFASQESFAIEQASMEVALVEFCGQLNIDVNAVKQLALCVEEPMMSDIFSTTEKISTYLDLFKTLVEQT